ncbi:MAG TPA: hypothetical protein VK886_16645 [Vicinamibacterales bacterium]|nr:hypothetical protein [Vicinamibacterales bacterium]
MVFSSTGCDGLSGAGAGLRPVLVALAAAGTLVLGACGDPAGPSASDVLSETTSTTHFEFHYSPGDAVDAPRQEAYHDWVLPYLDVAVSRKLQYFKYRDRAHLHRVTRKATNGWADPPAFAVHAIWPWDAHEAVHIYTALFGRPSDFFNEGIAVALSYDPLGGRFVSLWNNQAIHDIASNLLRTRALPSIPSIAEADTFRRQNDQVAYPVAGSFVSFVLDQRGVPAMKAFFGASSQDDRLGVIESRFSASFGWSLAEAEARWHEFLQ